MSESLLEIIGGQEWAGGALVRENERLRSKLDHAETVNGELVVERERLLTAIEAAIRIADRWPIVERPYVEGVVAKLISEPLRACQRDA